MSFGCVFALNRVHTPAGPADAGRVAEAEAEAEAEGGGERVADVLLLPVARRARVVRAVAGRRAVSGDRRVEVWIRGEEPLVVDAGSLAPAAGGYLAGRVAEGSEADLDFARLDLPGREELSEGGEPAGEGPVRVVSVVGLAHANGVLARCATMGLRDADALARAAGAAAELEWAES